VGAVGLADDLVVQLGRVSSRVALLLRAIERKPVASLISIRRTCYVMVRKRAGQQRRMRCVRRVRCRAESERGGNEVCKVSVSSQSTSEGRRCGMLW